MSNEDNVVTLPEITIEGNPDAQPANARDWWCQGFITGFNAPDTAAERPLMINDDLAAIFLTGVKSGQNSHKAMQAEWDARNHDSPQAVSDLGGESYAELQRRYNEEWEALLHEHMPHTEVEGEPGAPPVRPNIGFVPPKVE
jgi:hypothetical protein